MSIDNKIENGKGKLILRELLKSKIPNHLIDRPKAGFTIPISQWINGPLLDWSENLLSKNNSAPFDASSTVNFFGQPHMHCHAALTISCP